MEQAELKKILRLPKDEKIEIVQAIWDSIAEDQTSFKIPEEHIALLEERINIVSEGKTEYKSWEEIKKKYFKN